MQKILVWVVFFLLPTQLGKHFFLPFSFVQGVRVDYLAPAVYLTDILGLILVMWRWRDIVGEIKKRPRATLLLAGLGTVNILMSHQPYVTIYLLTLYGLLVGVGIVIYKIRPSLQNILSALISGGLLSLFLALYQLKTGQSLQGIAYLFGERFLSSNMPGVAKVMVFDQLTLRPYAAFSHPNSLGGFYLVLFLAGIASLEKVLATLHVTKDRISWLLLLILTCLSACLVLLSFSKMAIFVMAGSFLVLSFRQLSDDKKCLPCLIGRVLIVLSILLAFGLTQTGADNSLAQRVVLFQQALTLIQQNWLWGTGFGAYFYSQAALPSPYPYFFLQPVHSIFVLWIVQTGILGLGVIAYFLWRGRTILRRFLSLPSAHYVTAGVILTGFADHYWFTSHQNLYLLVVLPTILTAIYSSTTGKT